MNTAASLTRAALVDPFSVVYPDLRHSRLHARDGWPLDVYECGQPGAPRIFVVNPIGVPLVLASRLLRRLAERHHVVCWEQRGCRAEPQDFVPPPTFTDFVDDLACVIAAKGGDAHALIGICSGAAVVVRALAGGRVDARRVLLVSPAVPFVDGYSPSIFDQAVVPYLRLIAGGDVVMARNLLALRALHAAQDGAVHTDDEKIVQWADQWPMRSLDSVLVYSRVVDLFCSQAMDSDLPQLRRKVHVVTAADDQTVSLQSVRGMTALLPDAELLEIPTGGHFMVFLRPELPSLLADLVATPREECA